jgi:hypothetical protein
MKGYIKYIAFLVVILLSILWLGGFFSKRTPTREVAKESKVVQGLTVGTVEKTGLCGDSLHRAGGGRPEG